jgi:ABC-type phosphate/phosphonate transport system ATPase subunit
MISLRNLEKSYPLAGGRNYVLRQITLDIARGEFVTIRGPSGAGKSTLLSIIGMLDGSRTRRCPSLPSRHRSWTTLCRSSLCQSQRRKPDVQVRELAPYAGHCVWS